MNVSNGPFQYVIISRTKHNGFPEFNRHTLAESAQTEEQALVYARHRVKAGFWVDVYKELYYDTGETNVRCSN